MVQSFPCTSDNCCLFFTFLFLKIDRKANAKSCYSDCNKCGCKQRRTVVKTKFRNSRLWNNMVSAGNRNILSFHTELNLICKLLISCRRFLFFEIIFSGSKVAYIFKAVLVGDLFSDIFYGRC